MCLLCLDVGETFLVLSQSVDLSVPYFQKSVISAHSQGRVALWMQCSGLTGKVVSSVPPPSSPFVREREAEKETEHVAVAAKSWEVYDHQFCPRK